MQLLESSINALCIDGMDQSKLKTPRLGYKHRASKTFEKLYRPTLHLTVCWLHGHMIEMAVGDEDMKKNSESQTEIMARCINNAYHEYGGLPAGLHLQADNCFREQKNQYIMSWACLLVTMTVYRFVQLGFLRTGHSFSLWFDRKPFVLFWYLSYFFVGLIRSWSLKKDISGHDDCDQVIGQIAKLLAGVSFDTPDEAIDHINNLTARPAASARDGKKPRTLHKTRAWAYKLDETTEWKKWGAQLAIKVKGLRSLVARNANPSKQLTSY